jgi:uncharacterized LabA/DUF88 family protein
MCSEERHSQRKILNTQEYGYVLKVQLSDNIWRSRKETSVMSTKQRAALFIDAENAAPSDIDEIIKFCESKGRIVIARCYGRLDALKGWEKANARHFITPVCTPPSANKENASDFALMIDAISLLHSGRFDNAVIATSDSDFIQLALHIREFGKGIDGIGSSRATKALRSSFDGFHELAGGTAPVAVKKKAPSAKPDISVTPATKRSNPRPEIDKSMLLKCFAEASKGNTSANKTTLAQLLSKASPKYKSGYRTIDNYLRHSELFEVDGNTVKRKG